MRILAERLAEKVDCSGEHHLWTGSKKSDGTGKMKVDGKTVTARRVAWELAHGPLPDGAEVRSCPAVKACVRLHHLAVDVGNGGVVDHPSMLPRSRKGAGSMRQVGAGRWKLTVTGGRHPDGSSRRAYRAVRAVNKADAARQLSAFVAEVGDGHQLPARGLRDLTVDEAIERFLTEHLSGEKGRSDRTVSDYRKLHRRWFSPIIGDQLVSRVDRPGMDDAFGRMRRAGLSRSQLNQARSLYAPFFRWAKQRGMTSRSPMSEFELPTSMYVPRERTPPEVEELCLMLDEAAKLVPDVAPLLALGAVTGMRRGELVSVRRSRVRWEELRITVDAASDGKRVRTTKTRKERSFYLDTDTMTMLRFHCQQTDELAAAASVTMCPDPYLFSATIDGSQPMSPDHATRQVAVLKEHLGIADKNPDTIEREDRALDLFRCDQGPRPSGKTGPAPTGGMSYREIGAHFDRSERWAALAVRSAKRREAAKEQGRGLDFDGSILALRKFTSSELLDAGFNISMVAQRQGHGPQVLTKHYAKSRRSADRKAAEHLGRIVHKNSVK